MSDEQNLTDGEKLRRLQHLCQAIVNNTEELEGADASLLIANDWKLAICRDSAKTILEIVVTVNQSKTNTSESE